MAKGKKSFVLYADLIHTVEKMPDDIAGKLFKLILEYVNDKDPEPDDILMKIAFEPVRQQLKRDLKKWNIKHDKRVEAGRKGGLARASNARQNKAMLGDAKQTQANQAVNVSVSANVSVNDIVDRESAFKKEVFSHDYPQYLLQAFYSYWSEPTKNKKKMRYEMQKTWDTKRRLTTWASRDDKYSETVEAKKRADSKIIRYD